MTIIDHSGSDWSISEKGKKDAERHRSKIVDQIKKKALDVIAEESIITSKKGKTVRVPIKGLKDYKFKYGNKEDGLGIGQGKGEPGDVVGRKQKGNGKGKPGNEPGEDIMEVEVDIDYLLQIIFEELGLPYIEEKTTAKQAIPKGFKFEAVEKKGIFSHVNKKRSIGEAVKRNMAYAYEVMRETQCEEDMAFRALIQTNFEINDAIELIRTNAVDQSIDPDLIFVEDDDVRFNKIENDIEYKSQCVILAAIDSSGSMTTQKKFLCRTFLFWVTKFLEKTYDNVKIRFIIHTTKADLVSEDDFFNRMESGGTYCHTAFDLMKDLIENEYKPEEWNIYAFYSSDGEDFDIDKSISSVKSLLNKGLNMFAYAEIIPEEDQYGLQYETLMEALKLDKSFFFKKSEEKNTEFYKDLKNRVLLCKIKNKEHIAPALRHFLFEKSK